MSVGKVVQNISPASQQRFELGISSSCCRSLFGPIDHAQLRAELKSELRRIADEKKRRWNFDFLEVKPLKGDFLWQRIGENPSVDFVTNDEPKSCFSERIMPQRSSTATTHAVSNATTRNTASHSRKTCFETPERLAARRLRKSPRITDYLPAKKRSTSRQIKYSAGEAGVLKLHKRVQTRKATRRSRPAKQSTLDQFLPKLRPRQSNGKVQVSS